MKPEFTIRRRHGVSYYLNVGLIARLFVLFIGLSVRMALGQCPTTGSVILVNQAQVDAFSAQGCTTVPLNLVISGPTITNVSGLNSLTSVGFDLRIEDCPNLVSITGFSNLVRTGNNLQLGRNGNLGSITGFTSLTSVGGDIRIEDDPSLLTISGLSKLTSVGVNCQLGRNAQLPSLTGLSSLTNVGGVLRVEEDPNLVDISALSNLIRIGRALQVNRNDKLPNLNGLNKVTFIGGGLELQSNPRLVDITGLSNLPRVQTGLIVKGNTLLPSLTGFSSLTSVGGSLVIQENPTLTNLAGLSPLVSVGVDFVVASNNQLLSLTSVPNLTSVGGSVNIEGNAKLKDITGLSNINRIGGALTIVNNPQLSACAIAPVCNFLSLYLGTNTRYILISGNAAGCALPQEVQADCVPLAFTSPPVANSPVCVGQTVTFQVGTSGNVRTYQWFKDGVPLTGNSSATTAALTVENAQTSDAGSYRVAISNSVSSLTSTAFSLAVNPLPSPGISASASLIVVGQAVTLTATGGVSYRWNNGAVTNPITVTPPVGTTVYSVTATNAASCTATASISITATASMQVSGPASLCVKSAPPASSTVTLPLRMTVTNGLPPYRYRWAYKPPASTEYKPIEPGGTSIGKVSFVPVADSPTLNITSTNGNLNGLQGYYIRLTITDNANYTSSAETLLEGDCPITASGAREGLFKTESVQVMVGPNPVRDVLQVDIQGLAKPAQIGLFDLQGRVRGQWEVVPQEGVGRLKAPVSALADGLYLLQVETADGVLHRQRVLRQQ